MILSNKLELNKDVFHFVTERFFNSDFLWGEIWKYDDFNLWLHVWDVDENVIKNRKKLAKYVKMELSDFIFMNQVHSGDVVIVWKKDKWKWSKSLKDAISIDAMITDVPWIVLIVLVADCIPVLFYDKLKKVIWVAHAGWKWTEKNIVWNVVNKMIKHYNSDPNNIIACLWPAISKKSFEVWKEVAVKFDSQFYIEKPDKKYLLDLQSINKKQLLDLWVLEDNIEVSREDTFSSNKYFSARRFWYNSWRFWAGIFLKNNK